MGNMLKDQTTMIFLWAGVMIPLAMAKGKLTLQPRANSERILI